MLVLAKITWASVDYDDTLPFFGAGVIIHLDNRQVLFFSLEAKAREPEYAVLRFDKRLFGVKTDGESIFWPSGPRLMFDEIIDMLRQTA